MEPEKEKCEEEKGTFAFGVKNLCQKTNSKKTKDYYDYSFSLPLTLVVSMCMYPSHEFPKNEQTVK